jgi:cell wall assembly regulator SMI1
MNQARAANKLLLGALLNANTERVEQILREGKFDESDDAMLIQVIKACADQVLICKLIEHGWNANAVDPHFSITALMHAARNGLPRVVDCLLGHGADVQGVDDNKSNAAKSACSAKSKSNVESLRILISHGIDVNQGKFYSPMMWAIDSGTEEMVTMLLEAGADPNRVYGRGTALHMAIIKNKVKAVESLLLHGAASDYRVLADWEKPEHAGLTMLELAQKLRRNEIGALLLGKTPEVKKAPTLKSVWKGIEKGMKSLEVDPAECINAGATTEELSRFSSQFGNNIPNEVIESWKIHNGQPQHCECFRLPSTDDAFLDEGTQDFRLLSIDEMKSQAEASKAAYYDTENATSKYQGEPGVASKGWSEAWVPLAKNFVGDLLCCDLRPAEGGVVGQIILVSSENPVRTRIASSWLECLGVFSIAPFQGDEE